ncbi:AraC family transcriptional regulator [Alteromonas lipolytica]|uniref:HTH araC/xylS-type domain-containing protein n=1 Tax=Alteromonas lipolytica TaxID=1856405 RepID=A0A1E8FC58_9ALTE|nr:AraC family transcriptional regulator [Alteromonas lipolytica]OFI33479.1 hypothetical protein BFC17_04255 [Alteromonas lipolytica]GGF59317.1 AraC family transcriptional regulator [Alteromonas lipolytica]
MTIYQPEKHQKFVNSMQDDSLSSGRKTRVSAQKIQFLYRVVKELNLPCEDLLSSMVKRLDITPNYQPTVKLSDVVRIYEELSECGVPALALEIGKRISCGDYGLYGCTLLCKRQLIDALRFAVKYQTLVTRTTSLVLTQEDDDTVFFGCEDILFQPELIDFNLELQMSINFRLFRDILGDPDFAPRRVFYAFPKPKHHKLLEEDAKCEVLYQQSKTGVELSMADVQRAPSKTNPLAVPLLLKVCNEQILDFMNQSETVEKVYSWVSQNIHNDLKIEKVAEELCVSERTLRRKLSENGTSFSEICLTIKKGFAKKYLRDTKLSYDDISESLGFKDTSNFRHAFKSWTGQTPMEYRNDWELHTV